MASQGDKQFTTLSEWNRALDRALAFGQADLAAQLGGFVLQHLPRHLPTYQRLLQAMWLEQRWEEGEEWARRLLQADPGNAYAWRALAQAAEQEGERGRAHAMWRRAFEMSPYDPDIRAGLARTTVTRAGAVGSALADVNALAMDSACLAAIQMRGQHWTEAEISYRQLVKADPRRIDFQLGLMLAHWQARAGAEAYALARYLVDSHPHLLPAWAVLDATGDENDQALARHPIATMDPDGEYMSWMMGTPAPSRRLALPVEPHEAAILEYVR
jgi:tetratricopeptide (TPR) repeat protein